MRKLFFRKHAGFSELLIVLGLVLVGVILISLFKDQIGSAVSSVISSIKTQLTSIGSWTSVTP